MKSLNEEYQQIVKSGFISQEDADRTVAYINSLGKPMNFDNGYCRFGA